MYSLSSSQPVTATVAVVVGGGAEVGGGEAVGGGDDGGGEGGGPSRLRLPKDGSGGLPRDMTRRRPEVCDGEGRMRRGQRCGEPAGTLASPEAGGEADDDTARREAWWSAARCLRRALAAAPR